MDSLLTSLVADNVTRSYHDSDKELVGQGIGNLVAGIFGGIASAVRAAIALLGGGGAPGPGR